MLTRKRSRNWISDDYQQLDARIHGVNSLRGVFCYPVGGRLFDRRLIRSHQGHLTSERMCRVFTQDRFVRVCLDFDFDPEFTWFIA